MNKALFLDRDGVINVDYPYVSKISDFEFIDGIFELCKLAQLKKYLIIVITNQAGIGRGYYSEQEFLDLNDWMLSRFREEGVNISKVYWCPYHPVHGLGRYKRNSSDRKPYPGMFLKAQKDYDINMNHSIVVGNNDTDIIAGYNARVGKRILLGNNVTDEIINLCIIESNLEGVSKNL